MFALSFALLALAGGFQQTAPQSQSEPSAAAAPAAAPVPQAETRQVCRFETVTGSNRRTRVCRQVSSAPQDQTTREFMRDAQRVRMPDAN